MELQDIISFNITFQIYIFYFPPPTLLIQLYGFFFSGPCVMEEINARNLPLHSAEIQTHDLQFFRLLANA